MTARVLDADLLEQLGSRLRSQGVPAIEAARPGLGADAMQALVSPLGVSLPLEARVWWGWHDGVPRNAGATRTEIGPGRKWLPLDEAVAQCVQIRQMIAETVNHERQLVEAAWSSKWIPLVHFEAVYVIDTDVPEGSACPVRVYWFDEPHAPPDLPSFGELVWLWIQAIDRGAWHYDPDADHWTVNHAILESWPAAKRGIV